MVAWRTAGHYARAATLLVRVRAGAPLAGDAAETARALEERLATLTATATIAGRVEPGAVIRVDDDPAERAGDAIVLDVGDHDVTIEQESCAVVVWHGTAYPGAQLAIPFVPRCDRGGTLHVYLAGDPGAAFAVDDAEHHPLAHEADVKLEPGTHRLRVASLARPVLDEPIAIRTHETTAVRVRYPWRARRMGFILGITGSARAGGVLDGLGLAVTTGVWGSWGRATVDFGSVMSTHDNLGPPGHPWFGASGALHVIRRPLWTGKLATHRLALDFDPVAVRYDELRSATYFGIRAAGTEAIMRSVSGLPLSLSADGPYVHAEVALWPFSILSYSDASGSARGYGAFVTILGGWRL